jgi:hypothetical protein
LAEIDYRERYHREWSAASVLVSALVDLVRRKPELGPDINAALQAWGDKINGISSDA